MIAQEIMQTEDTPEEHVHDLFGMAFWPGHPLARPIAGSVESIGRYGRSEFVEFMRARYRPDRILIAGAGALTHDALVAGVERELGSLAGESRPLELSTPQRRDSRGEPVFGYAMLDGWKRLHGILLAGDKPVIQKPLNLAAVVTGELVPKINLFDHDRVRQRARERQP